jgi:putative ABC transport system permease protein
MRPEAPRIGKRTLIERIPFLWKHLNFTWKSSLRNLFRYKKRFFMTLFGIGGCMGLLMVGFGLRDSITSIATYQYGDLHLYDSSVFVEENMEDETRAELEDYLEKNVNVSAHMNVHMSSITAENDDNEVDAYLTVIDDLKQVNKFFVFRDRVTEDGYKLSDKGVILTEKASKMLGVKVGDRILLSEEGKNEKKVKVTAICENYAGHYVYLTSSLYEELYGETPFYNNILIKVDEELAFKDLQNIGEKILTYDHILNVQYTDTLSGQLNDMLYALDKVMIVLIMVAGMLSFVVLYNLNNINITERRRELATLKVLGFYDGEVATYVYRENILLTLLGTIVGCFAGKLLHLFTITTVEVDMAMFGREIFPISYVYGAVFTIGFSAFVNWIMYFKLKKIDMVESLKSVE